MVGMGGHIENSISHEKPETEETLQHKHLAFAMRPIGHFNATVACGGFQNHLPESGSQTVTHIV